MQIQKRLDEIEAAKARVGTLIKDFFADLHIEMHRLGTFRPVPEQITNQPIVEALDRATTALTGKKKSRRGGYKAPTPTRTKNRALKLIRKGKLTNREIAMAVGVTATPIRSWRNKIKAGKL